MVTLEIDYKTLDEYLNLEQRVANFESSLNNLNNNLSYELYGFITPFVRKNLNCWIVINFRC